MQQHDLRQPKGAKHKRKRIGRGNASGHGTYSTRGMKGQKARSGGGVRPGFEGGQLGLIRRMARKRGFTNAFRVDYEEVNVGKLARFEANTTVTADLLRAERLVQSRTRPLKILGFGALDVALKVEAARFSKSAKEKIEAAGGSIHWIDGEPTAKEDLPETKKRKRGAKRNVKPVAAAPKAEASGDAPTADAPDEKPKKQTKKQDPAGADDAAQEEATDGAGS